MLVGTLIVEIYVPGSTSLKDKRQVVKSMIARIQNRFNVSVAELNSEDLWQRSTIGVAMIGNHRDYLERKLQLVLNFMDAEPRWEVTQVQMELS